MLETVTTSDARGLPALIKAGGGQARKLPVALEGERNQESGEKCSTTFQITTHQADDDWLMDKQTEIMRRERKKGQTTRTGVFEQGVGPFPS